MYIVQVGCYTYISNKLYSIFYEINDLKKRVDSYGESFFWKQRGREREAEHYIDNENSNNGEKLCSVWEEKEFPFRGDGGGRGHPSFMKSVRSFNFYQKTWRCIHHYFVRYLTYLLCESNVISDNFVSR